MGLSKMYGHGVKGTDLGNGDKNSQHISNIFLEFLSPFPKSVPLTPCPYILLRPIHFSMENQNDVRMLNVAAQRCATYHAFCTGPYISVHFHTTFRASFAREAHIS